MKWIVLVAPGDMSTARWRLDELKCSVMSHSIAIDDKLALYVDGPKNLPAQLGDLAEVCTNENILLQEKP